MQAPEERMKVFFSYGHDCEEIVLKIQNDLCELGFDVWVDSSEIKAGNDWRERITSGILNSDSVMAFLSERALRKNGVCLNELSIAVGCKYGHIKTILLEPEIEHLVPSTISSIQYLDMSKWRILKKENESAFNSWYEEKLRDIVELLSSKEAAEMNSQLKYLEQMLSPAMWQPKQQFVLQKPYIPRTEAERELEKWLSDKNGSRAYLLYGEPGCGKSSFLINYHHFNHESCAIAFCDWKRQGRDKLSEIIRSIAFQLAAKIPAYRSSLAWHLESNRVSVQDIDDASLFEHLIVMPMHGAIVLDGEKHLILIDGINELNDKSTNPLAEIITTEGDKLPEFIRFIITARRCSVVPQYFSGSASYEFQTASDSTIATIRDFYALELEDSLKDFSEIDSDRILDTLAKRSDGNFLFAELCAKAIREKKMSLNDLTSIPCDLNGVFYRWFTLLFPNEDVYLEQYYQPLSVLCAVDDPVPIDLLRKVMNWSPLLLNGFLRLFKDFLKCQENAFGKKTVTLFHFSMKTWLLSESAGCFEIDGEEGLMLLEKHLTELFNNETISPYQCKLLISVLEKTQNDQLRRKIYGSSFFFNQYYALAKAYERVRSGYHKAILIYTHLKEICIGLPSEENGIFLRTVYPFAMSRCFCQIGDYDTAGELLTENLESLEAALPPSDLMECYYILGSVYDWLGNRGASVEIFTKLRELATAENDSSYLLRAIAGLVWSDHFTNISCALERLEQLSPQNELSSIDRQMAELIKARILLSTGELDDALRIYDECLLSFDFSFQNDVRGYRKNRLMLIEILPACYDMGKFEKGVETGKQIIKKIKNTGWLEECYCSSWISLNYLGMGKLDYAERYLERAKRHLEAVDRSDRSHWMTMHLSSIEAFLLSEKGLYTHSLEKHIDVVRMASQCNDTWVEGDACFEIAKLILLYECGAQAEAKPYIDRLCALASASALAHLLLKSRIIIALYSVITENRISEETAEALRSIPNEKALASTNYVDIYYMIALIYKTVGTPNDVRDAVRRIREFINRPEYRSRPSSWLILNRFRETKESYVNFNLEYCDPFDNEMNYWMRLEHLGRYLWAADECRSIPDSEVADVACANGYGTLILSKSSKSVHGFDRSAEYISRAPKAENLEYVVCDLDSFSPEGYEDRFDLITCFETVEHVKKPDSLVKLLHGMLKPGGTLLISFPNSVYEKTDEYGLNKDEYHLHVFEKEEMLNLLRSTGFEIADVLGQSYCNEKCNEENDAVKAGLISADELRQKHEKSEREMEEDSRALSIPSEFKVDESYSYILRCKKLPRQS